MAGPSRLAGRAISGLKQPIQLQRLTLNRSLSSCAARRSFTLSTTSKTSPRSLSAAVHSTQPSSPALYSHRLRFSSTPASQSNSNGNGDGETAGDVAIKQMTAEGYDEVSERDMDLLHDRLEELCEEYAPEDWEVEYSSGVMNLFAPPNGTYVINKQPPNQQIWLSSPLSGPMRFGYSPNGTWVHHRKSDVTLGRILEEELKGLLKEAGGEEGWQGPGLE